MKQSSIAVGKCIDRRVHVPFVKAGKHKSALQIDALVGLYRQSLFVAAGKDDAVPVDAHSLDNAFAVHRNDFSVIKQFIHTCCLLFYEPALV